MPAEFDLDVELIFLQRKCRQMIREGKGLYDASGRDGYTGDLDPGCSPGELPLARSHGCGKAR
jgi:hypothetical protein